MFFFFKICFKAKTPKSDWHPTASTAARGAAPSPPQGLAVVQRRAAAATSAVKAEKKRKAGCCSSLHGGVTGGGGAQHGAAAFVWFSLCQPSLSWNPQIAHQMNTAFSLTPVSFSVCSYCPPSPLLCAPPHAFKAFCRRPSSCAYVKNNKPPLSFRMAWTRTRTNMVQLGFEPETIINIGT